MSWAKVKLADIASMRTGKLDSNAAVPDGDYPFFTCSQQTLRINEPAYDTEAVLLGGNNAAGVFPLKYYQGEFNAYQRTYILESRDSTKLSTRYLYFALRPALSHFQTASIGAATQYLTKGILDNFPIALPPITHQERIASILSAYDDLIENNRRRIQLLEESARLLYKEWFVHLRFPGHEHTKIINGVPEGWKKVPFEQLLKSHIGGGWGKDEHESNETEPAYVIRGTDFSSARLGRFNEIGLRYHKESTLRDRILAPGDILLEVSGGSANQPIGRTLFITQTFLDAFDCAVICASFCKRLQLLDITTGVFAFYFLRHIRDTGELLIFNKNSASALQNFNFKAFLEYQQIVLPSSSLLREFGDVVAEIERQIVLLSLQIYRCAKARDLLLPRLMNGEISV